MLLQFLHKRVDSQTVLIKPDRNLRCLEPRSCPVRMNSEDSRRVFYDSFLADGRRLAMNVIWCHEGREALRHQRYMMSWGQGSTKPSTSYDVMRAGKHLDMNVTWCHEGGETLRHGRHMTSWCHEGRDIFHPWTSYDVMKAGKHFAMDVRWCHEGRKHLDVDVVWCREGRNQTWTSYDVVRADNT